MIADMVNNSRTVKTVETVETVEKRERASEMSLDKAHGAELDESSSALVAGGNERDTNCQRARLAWPVKVFAMPQRTQEGSAAVEQDYRIAVVVC
jgi:hypothetical protein